MYFVAFDFRIGEHRQSPYHARGDVGRRLVCGSCVAQLAQPIEEGEARTLIWQSFGVSYTGDVRLEQTS